MTAFGSGQSETEFGSINVEIRSVNNRYLDLNLRIPEDLRFFEPRARELAGIYAKRGKLEIKFNYSLTNTENAQPVDEQALLKMAAELNLARQHIPDLAAPTWADIPRQGSKQDLITAEKWSAMCEQACDIAFKDFQANREREGARMSEAMLDMAKECEDIVQQIELDLPVLLNAQQEKISQKLAESLASVNPDGFSAISGPELSARIAQETSLFGLKVDVAEEITRQKSHIQELREILTGKYSAKNKHSSGFGKRMDFLFQEMNREANTLGSKSAGIAITQAAIDLKLLIEQLREQAQNIE